MKILHVINSLYSGGAEKLVLELVTSDSERADVQYGVCPLVLRSDALEDEICTELMESGVTVHKIRRQPNGNRLSTIWNLIGLIRKNHYDVVHTHCFSPDFYGRLAAVLSGRPVKVVNTLHTMQYHASRARKMLDRSLGKITHTHIACSSAVKKWAVEDGGLKQSKIRVIYNGIDLKKLNSEVDWYKKLRRELGIDENSRVLGWVGRLSGVKYVQNLVYILDELRKLEIEAQAVIIGTGDEQSSIEQLASQMDLSSRIHFLGYRDDALDLMQAFDVFVLPSIREGMPLVVLEAMAAGVPVVANNLEGLHDVIINGKTGLLVDDNNPKVFAEKIEQIMMNDSFRTGIIKNSQDKIVEFSLQRTIEQYIATYDTLLTS